MTTDKKPNPRVPALYFNKKGHGPDLINLELRDVDHLPGGKIACGLMIAESDNGAPYVVAPLGDGFYLEQDQVAALYQACGEWLSKNASRSASSPAVPADDAPEGKERG